MRFKVFKQKTFNEDLQVNENNKIYLKDFFALCIAAFQILIPIFIVAFIVFTVCVFLLMEFWTK